MCSSDLGHHPAADNTGGALSAPQPGGFCSCLCHGGIAVAGTTATLSGPETPAPKWPISKEPALWMWGTALPPGQQTPTHPHPAIAGGSDSLRKGPGPRGGLPETRRSRRVPQQLPAAGPLAEWSLRRPDDTVREAVAKPAPRPPGTQPRARGQGAERSRPGAVLGPWGDRSTCPPVPRFVVRSGSWASPWGPGPVPALPPAVAPEPLARAAECHSLPPLEDRKSVV